MREKFKSFIFRDSTRNMIAVANEIITELRDQGYTLTLRQLYYQLVSRDIIANKQTEYKRLGSILNDARLAGMVDWSAIEDRTRYLQSVPHWNDPSDIISTAAASFRIDKWKDQDYRIEVWVEKDALVGVLSKACRELDVAWFSCRGYTSQTAQYNAGKRMADYFALGQTPVIIHLGDHDPSGIDMTRDNMERVMMFAEQEVEVKRIALNMDQIERYNPPPNPAKSTDSRFKGYRQKHGLESWELDALDPRVIHALIEETVLEYRDEDKWDKAMEEENIHRELLAKSAEKWNDVASFITSFKTKNKNQK